MTDVLKDKRFLLIAAILFAGSALANWAAYRDELRPERRPLTELSERLGSWQQRGSEIRFDEGVERVLRVSDYTMREYTSPEGRIANLYVGYYDTQRTGSTYHSPQNCLPGAGWVLSEPDRVTVTTTGGREFEANKYVIENGQYREVMLYWYQGRSRTEASEYRDKLNTVIDSIFRRRTDGAMVRVMTSAGRDDASATAAAVDLAGALADSLPEYIPE
ncbi:MAG: EpsI family protein [Pyrinomonadaceae bacterium]|nr:EpsI family protein [Pyrinomonadaceae bacterium]